MAVKAGKREVARMVAVLDAEHETVEDAARAALDEAFAIYESRAKFNVVGQLYFSMHDGGHLRHSDERAVKVSLGMFSTEGDARRAAESLTYSTQTHEQFRSWVLPVHHGTPADFYRDRKKAWEKVALGLTPADRLIFKMEAERREAQA